MEGQRRAPPPIRKILDFDEALTERFCRWSHYFSVFRILRRQSKKLEISCHGIPWFAGVILFIVATSSSFLHQQQVNLLFGFIKSLLTCMTYAIEARYLPFYRAGSIGLILDVILVAVIKAYVRRRRPNKNRPDMFATFSIDNFSFPSGHASRSVLLAYFFTFLCPLPGFFAIPLIIWVFSVCISRVLLNRHYLLDVISGVILGYLEGILLGILWMNQDLSNFLISWLSDSTYEAE